MKRRRTAAWPRLAPLWIGLSLLGAPAAAALETNASLGPVSLLLRLEPDAPVIGDPMTLEIEAVAEPGVEVLMPDFGEALDRFAIVDFVPRENLDEAGSTHFSQRYTLQLPMSGPQTLPALRVEFIDHRPDHPPAPEGQDAYEILSDPIAFEVASVVPDPTSADLAPPLGPLPDRAPGRLRPWACALGVSLLLLGAGPFAWRLWRGRRDRIDARTAFEVARGELDALLCGPRSTPEEIDVFFVRLSGIVRQYLERRFAIRSPELTTERFLEEVSRSPDLGRTHRELLADFLQQSDLVKFAHLIPSQEAIAEAIASANRFLDETRDDRPIGATDARVRAGAA